MGLKPILGATVEETPSFTLLSVLFGSFSLKFGGEAWRCYGVFSKTEGCLCLNLHNTE